MAHVHRWVQVEVVQHPRRVIRFPIDRYRCEDCGVHVEVPKGSGRPRST